MAQTRSTGRKILDGLVNLTKWTAAEQVSRSDRGRLRNRVAGPSQLDQYGTYPASGLTPEGLTSILKTADQGDVVKQSELFMQIEEKDLRIQGVLQSRRLAVASLDWEVIPASEDAKDVEIAQAVSTMLQEIGSYRPDDPNIISDGFDVALADLLDAIGKGFSVVEVMWKQLADATLVPVELRWVPQTRFTFYEFRKEGNRLQFGGKPRLLTEEESVKGVDLPPYKFMVHRAHHRAGYPSKAGLLRTLCWFYLFKNYGIKDWAVLLERYTSPFRIGKYPRNAGKQVKDDLEDALARLGVDAYAIMSEDAQLEFVTALQKGSTASNKEFIDYIDKEISIAVLGHPGSSEATPGKLGNEQMAGDLRQDLLEADAKQLMATVNSQLVRYFVELNYGMDVAVPKFKLHYEPKEDLTEDAYRVSNLLKLGIPVSEKWLRDKYDLPKPESDEDSFRVDPTGGGGFPDLATAKQVGDRRQRVMVASEAQARRQMDTVDAMSAAREKKTSSPSVESLTNSKNSWRAGLRLVRSKH